tara:strand:+ start:7520 stop:9040 length:1521 start_codon:yes stop_codon:yes gene_type:complete
MAKKEKRHWADLAGENVIREQGDKKEYCCASGITPSGTIHIGNFREIITTDLVVKALENKGKKVRFIYSWDDFDRFRKVPKNIPESFEEHIGMNLSDVPDPLKKEKSYALSFEKEMEDSIKDLGMDIEFIRQSEMYKKCVYAKDIKKALNEKDKAIPILNKYRKEPLPNDWMPLVVYCESCKKDSTNVLSYDGDYKVSYECECGFSNEVDFRKTGIVKLNWRLDWPMRQFFEKVDFEPAGKDHYAAGGSRPTTNQIIEAIWKREKVTDLIYEWIGIKGGKQFSSSAGNVTNVTDVLEVYEPEVVRFLFAGTRPKTEFGISFDLDVIKIYEDFDRLEAKYYAKEGDEKDKRTYELSCVNVPKKKPERIGFRHLTMLVQIYEGDVKKVSKDKLIQKRAGCAKNWLEKYAPDDFKFKIHEKVSKEVLKLLNGKQKESLKELIKVLDKKLDEQGLFNEFYEICEKFEIKNTEFFKGAYLALIGKEKGPRLASFILAIGKDKVKKLLKEIK